MHVPDICSIGDTVPFYERIEAARIATEDGPLRGGSLRIRFIDRLMSNKDLGDQIGGFPTAVEAKPEGHRYLGCSGFYTFKFPALKWGEETHQSMDEVYSGEGHFQMSVITLSESDILVMGVCLLQARTGYVYSPLRQPSGRGVKLTDRIEWEGQEAEMYAVLRQAMNDEVRDLSQAFPGQFMTLYA